MQHCDTTGSYQRIPHSLEALIEEQRCLSSKGESPVTLKKIFNEDSAALQLFFLEK